MDYLLYKLITKIYCRDCKTCKMKTEYSCKLIDWLVKHRIY